MKQFFLSLVVFLATLLISPLVWGDTEKAEFSIHLFQNGLPIADAELVIHSEWFETTEPRQMDATPSTLIWRDGDGETAVKTNPNGSVAGKISPGNYQITIKTNDQTFNFNLPLQPAENIQILVTFFTDGKKPLLNIESSVTGTLAGFEAAAEEDQEKGEGIFITQILSTENKKPIKDVQVFLSGLQQRLRTDEQGRIIAEIPAGTYSVSVLHPAYSSQTKEEIKIAKNQDTEVNFNLTPAGVELAEYVVLEPFLAGTLASVIEEQKTSAEVATILGAEQFSRSGASDVASALTRASGLTLVGGRFVFIRGLGERFSSTLVNGAAIPSPDPTRRVVPLDLFPTSILESVLVQKTYSVDRPGEFAGGTLEMRTRGIPEEFFFNFSAQTGINSQSTFSNALDYKGSNTDFLGFDDGARALPGSIAEASKDGPISPQTPFNPDGLTPSELEGLGEDLSDVWDVTDKKRGPDASFSTSIGDVFNFGDFRVGYIGAGGWEQQFRNQNEINREFSSSGNQTDDSLRLTQDFDVQRSWQEVQTNGYAAVEAEYKDQHRLFANLMFLRQTFDETRVSQGFTDAEVTDVRRTKLWNFSNQLLMNQVGGEHQFDWAKDLKIDWLYTNATAKRDEPKTRDYRYDEDRDGNFFFSRRADSNQIIYGDLTDKDESWRVDATLPLALSPNYKFSLQGGFIDQSKTRDSSIQRFLYFPVGPDSRNQEILSQPSLEDILQPKYIGPNGFQIRDSTRSTDSYNAKQDLFSYYGKLDSTFYDKVRIIGGLRWEDNDQVVETFQSVANMNEPITSELKRIDMLPAVSATLMISEKQQLRAGFSQTISRPDFRELSPAPFTDPNTNQETTGNPDLQQTDITNYDVRWEYYLSPNENFLAGFFWKDLTSPIERVTLPGVSLQTFQNADKARLYGFELELLKNIGFVHPYFENFFIGSNYTWSNSNVKLTPENLQAQTSSSRSLQGHSSQIFNFQIGYDNPNWGTQATLLYNITSERIVAVGLLGAPDKFEQPFNQLDFVLSQNINKWLAMRLTMRNLLNDKFIVKQGDEITREFKRGRQFNLGVRISY
jgi:TonB-dependent receptor